MNDLPAELKRALCDAFTVRSDGDDRWVVTSPMTFDDGDALPLIVVQSSDGWALTDDGAAIAHLFFDDFEYTEARFRRLRSVVDTMGATITAERRLWLTLPGAPTASDVGDFLQLLAQIQAVALMSSDDREQTRYVTTIRDRVVERLRGVPDYEPNWSPPDLGHLLAKYRADLRIVADDHADVVLFAASTNEKAAVAALTVHHFRRVDAALRPILAYHPKVGSEAVYRFQDEVNDEDAVVRVPPDDVTRLLPALRRRNVNIQEWSEPPAT